MAVALLAASPTLSITEPPTDAPDERFYRRKCEDTHVCERQPGKVQPQRDVLLIAVRERFFMHVPPGIILFIKTCVYHQIDAKAIFWSQHTFECFVHTRHRFASRVSGVKNVTVSKHVENDEVRQLRLTVQRLQAALQQKNRKK